MKSKRSLICSYRVFWVAYLRLLYGTMQDLQRSEHKEKKWICSACSYILNLYMAGTFSLSLFFFFSLGFLATYVTIIVGYYTDSLLLKCCFKIYFEIINLEFSFFSNICVHMYDVCWNSIIYLYCIVFNFHIIWFPKLI